jgi:uncharacterized protein (TIGR03435 family)
MHISWVAALVCVASFGYGQGFEVATVKPSAEMTGNMSIGRAPGGRFMATNASLKDLLMFAYDVRSFQISGGPSWSESAGFNIEAKPEGGEPRIDQLRGMVQKLLADRFQMNVHRETKEVPVYALVVGKSGPKLTPSVSEEMGISGSTRGRMIYRKVSTSLLARSLSQRMGKAVIDRTGITGEYDFTLEWVDDNQEGPSLFTALQEQLGLKLESAKGPVEMLVIDRVSKPTEN